MKEAIDKGIRRDDLLPGDLKLKRKAWTVFRQKKHPQAVWQKNTGINKNKHRF